MSIAWTSILPFLGALQRNQNMPDDDDDSNPPVDQFGRVLPSQGNGVAVGASQNNSAQTVALQNYQGQGNFIDHLVRSMTPYPAAGGPPQLMRLLQAGMQSSEPKQAQATNDPNGTTSQSGSPGGKTAQTPAQPIIGAIPGVTDVPQIPDIDLTTGLGPPPILAPPSLTVTNVTGCGSGDFTCLSQFGLGDPSAPGGVILQKIQPNSSAERPFWEAWIIEPRHQYTNVAEDNGRKGDDFWSRPGRTGSATFYEGLTAKDLEDMGFKVGNVLEAIGRPSTYNDPSDERVLRDARKSNTVTRSF